MRIVERVAGHYETQDVEMGTVYRWCPQTVVIECECRETAILTPSETTCGECGAEHTGLVREDLSDRQSQDDEDVHPWRYSGDGEAAGALPY